MHVAGGIADRWISQRGEDMPGHSNNQKSDGTVNRMPAQQMPQVSREEEVNQNNNQRQDYAHQALG